ncbi:transcriptional regulator with XRE-family HTH domain [Pseudochrobactrum saccharolyticum]|uniref:Transcriptional regulator with XRE-family HTH domain n=1 Tax=Pseudochrobactrum saccharolyticum TaxID=354352 RepID=A0A7W8EPP4_9HYPH|nr:helix-turn-helix transcriptional regulator [Pseudochrobactrum saccharolyticum]MBB5092805.1 transcriptional regulator with XRE-family HTH domain [Pseudochrobactrum saccharolyticum]
MKAEYQIGIYNQGKNTNMVFDDRLYFPYNVRMSQLKRLREKIGLTQKELGALAGTSQPQIKRLEDGDRTLTKQWAERLAPHLNTTAEALLFPKGDDLDSDIMAIVSRLNEQQKAQALSYLRFLTTPAGEN